MYTLGKPRFNTGDRVQCGKQFGIVVKRAYNQLLKREHTDRWVIRVYHENGKRCRLRLVAGDGKDWRKR